MAKVQGNFWMGAFSALAVMVFVLGNVVATPTPKVAAQDGGDGDEIDVLIEIVGVVESIEDDEIIIDGYTIAPAGAFNPSELEVGMTVSITGHLLNDDTIQVVSLEIVTDLDEDGVLDTDDNCPEDPNPDQLDTDADGIGDVCDPDLLDTDEDGVVDSLDNCPEVANADQLDTDADGIGDLCDPDLLDTDEDGVVDSLDNCPEVANADQLDTDADGIGDLCDPDLLDTDEDGVVDSLDNCPEVANADQLDTDGDGIGDLCDEEQPPVETCGQENHPVASALAEEFDIEYDVVMGWHCDGFGFGEIARALLLAEQAEVDPQELLDRKAGGEGWGNILKDYEVSPSDLAPGRVISGRHHNNDDEETIDTSTAGGNAQNNGNGNNGNQGNNGTHGNGNGNKGGNGKGNGHNK